MLSGYHRNVIFDTIDEISHLTLLPQVAATLSRAAGAFGFTSLGINGLPPPGEGADPVILSESTPPGFRDSYIEERLYLVDHICAHARVAYEPFRFSDAPYDRTQARSHERFVNALDAFDMGKGLIVPRGRPANLPACIWLAGKNPDLDEDATQAIQLILIVCGKQGTCAFPPTTGRCAAKHDDAT